MTLTGKLFRDAVISGANNIANNRAAVDELNVFPVPDGDTGTNMSMTIGNALPELKAAGDGISAGDAAKLTASAMLRGARGNSGVILSLSADFQRASPVRRRRTQKCCPTRSSWALTQRTSP